VLYEMVTGRLAFGGDTTALVFDAILNRNPIAPVRLNPEVPSKLEEIINKLLDKDRKLRYQHASDLEAELKRFKRDSDASQPAVTPTASAPVSTPSIPTPPTAPASSTPRGSRSRAKFSIIVAAVVVAAVIAAVFFLAPAAPALTERDVILIADFVNTT